MKRMLRIVFLLVFPVLAMTPESWRLLGEGRSGAFLQAMSLADDDEAKESKDKKDDDKEADKGKSTNKGKRGFFSKLGAGVAGKINPFGKGKEDGQAQAAAQGGQPGEAGQTQGNGMGFIDPAMVRNSAIVSKNKLDPVVQQMVSASSDTRPRDLFYTREDVLSAAGRLADGHNRVKSLIQEHNKLVLNGQWASAPITDPAELSKVAAAAPGPLPVTPNSKKRYEKTTDEQWQAHYEEKVKNWETMNGYLDRMMPAFYPNIFVPRGLENLPASPDPQDYYIACRLLEREYLSAKIGSTPADKIDLLKELKTRAREVNRKLNEVDVFYRLLQSCLSAKEQGPEKTTELDALVADHVAVITGSEWKDDPALLPSADADAPPRLGFDPLEKEKYSRYAPADWVALFTQKAGRWYSVNFHVQNVMPRYYPDRFEKLDSRKTPLDLDPQDYYLAVRLKERNEAEKELKTLPDQEAQRRDELTARVQTINREIDAVEQFFNQVKAIQYDYLTVEDAIHIARHSASCTSEKFIADISNVLIVSYIDNQLEKIPIHPSEWSDSLLHKGNIVDPDTAITNILEGATGERQKILGKGNFLWGDTLYMMYPGNAKEVAAKVEAWENSFYRLEDGTRVLDFYEPWFILSKNYSMFKNFFRVESGALVAGPKLATASDVAEAFYPKFLNRANSTTRHAEVQADLAANIPGVSFHFLDDYLSNSSSPFSPGPTRIRDVEEYVLETGEKVDALMNILCYPLNYFVDVVYISLHPYRDGQEGLSAQSGYSFFYIRKNDDKDELEHWLCRGQEDCEKRIISYFSDLMNSVYGGRLKERSLQRPNLVLKQAIKYFANDLKQIKSTFGQ